MKKRMVVGLLSWNEMLKLREFHGEEAIKEAKIYAVDSSAFELNEMYKEFMKEEYVGKDNGFQCVEITVELRGPT